MTPAFKQQLHSELAGYEEKLEKLRNREQELRHELNQVEQECAVLCRLCTAMMNVVREHNKYVESQHETAAVSLESLAVPTKPRSENDIPF